jgi:hypothetical protein
MPVTAALLLHRKGRNTDAERVLRDLITADSRDANVKISSRHLLSVVLDELGRFGEAFQWLRESKALARQTTNVARLEKEYDLADERRRQLLRELTPEMIRRWREETSVEPCRQRIAFLGGHPRSGTTLIEQILGAHPAIAAFDEPDAFVQEVWNQLAPMQASQSLTASALNNLPPARRAELRGRYFKSLAREVTNKSSAEVLLDKNPSPTAALHLWLRIFPELKVIIALRDPRDVIISSYFQNLMLTSTNANFLTVERAVKHYADLMDVWLRMRELGGFDSIETRYEDVVKDLNAEGRRVTQFLGLAWDSQQAKFHETAAQKVLFAPTYNDVAKPVHNRAVGRWQRYIEALAPIGKTLAPYCRAFGYAAD